MNLTGVYDGHYIAYSNLTFAPNIEMLCVYAIF